MTERYRQEVFNVLLAQLLQERGVVTAPESIIRSGAEHARRVPDLILTFDGLRTAIEGEVSDHPDAGTRARDAARRRVEEGIAHVGVAVVYPSELRAVEFSDLKPELRASQLSFAITSESGDSGFVEGDVGDLESALRRTFEQLVHEDVVEQAVAALSAGIEVFSRAIAARAGVVDRVAATLGILDVEGVDVPSGEAEE